MAWQSKPGIFITNWMKFLSFLVNVIFPLFLNTQLHLYQAIIESDVSSDSGAQSPEHPRRP